MKEIFYFFSFAIFLLLPILVKAEIFTNGDSVYNFFSRDLECFLLEEGHLPEFKEFDQN